MKTTIDQLPIELCEVVLSVLREIPQNAQLYWARNQDVLLKVLNKVKDFEPLTLSDAEPYVLPRTNATTRGILWKKRHIQETWREEFSKNILKIYPAQPSALIGAYHINVDLHATELFAELGISSANDLSWGTFEYPQITSLLARHKDGKEKESIVGYEGSNYFPITLPTGEVEFMSFCSRRPWRVHAGWRGWFMGPGPYFKKGKLLFKKAAT